MSDLLSGALPPVSLADQIACVERELGMRRRVYPGWVERKKLTQAKADEEIRRMEAVLATLKGLARPKSLLRPDGFAYVDDLEARCEDDANPE